MRFRQENNFESRIKLPTKELTIILVYSTTL